MKVIIYCVVLMILKLSPSVYQKTIHVSKSFMTVNFLE